MINSFGQNLNSKKQIDFNEIKSKILPVIKIQTNSGSNQAISLPKEDQPVVKIIAGDLVCLYGINKGNYFELVKKSNISDSLNITILDKIARQNLLNEIGKKIQLQQTDFGAYGFTCGGEYEAAMITLPEIWEIITQKLGSNIVFCVPSKDVCLFAGENDLMAINKLKEIIYKVHTNGDHLLSKKLFLYKQGQISEK